MHLSLPLFSFTQWKDKCASFSFTTKKLTHSMCQVSLVVKYMRFKSAQQMNVLIQYIQVNLNGNSSIIIFTKMLNL